MPGPLAADDLIRAKLPLWQTVKQAYALTLGNLPTIFVLSWKWALLILPFLALYYYHAYPALEATYSTLGTPSPVQMPFLVFLVAIVLGMCAYLLFSKPAVGWHRFILRQEGADSDMHFDDATWRYAGFILLIYGLLNIPGLIQQLLLPAGGELPSTGQVLGSMAAGLCSVLGLLLLFRFTIILPATAVGDTEVSLRTVMRLTRGQTFRLLFGNLLTAAPFSLIMMAGMYLSLTRSNQLTSALLIPVLTFVGYLGVSASLAFTSLAYRFVRR